MNRQRKMILLATMTGLTGIAATGCMWQYKRYRESQFRWERIDKNLKKFSATDIEKLPLERLVNKFWVKQ